MGKFRHSPCIHSRLFIDKVTNYRIARTKSSKPEASKRMVSAKKPSSAYPKARGLITK